MLKSLSMICAFLVALTACNFNNENITPKQGTSFTRDKAASGKAEVMVVNGRLKFSDQAAFEATMELLLKADQKGLIEWEKALGHQSLRAYYESIDNNPKAEARTEDLFRSEKLLFVPDYRFATVLNRDGVVQVGNKIVKINQHEEYIITDGNEHTLHSRNWRASNVIKRPIAFQYVTAENSRGGRMEENFWGWKDREVNEDIYGRTLPTTWNGRPTRLKGSKWNVSYLLYTSTGIRTKYQFKTLLAGWEPCDASLLTLEGEGSGRYVTLAYLGPRLVSTYPYTTRYNDNILDKTLFWGTGTGSSFVLDYLWCKGSSVYKGATARFEL